MLNNIKGLTLISLIVTVIILLILTGVSITAVTNRNGLLSKANEVKMNTELTEEEEQTFNQYEQMINTIIEK